MYKFILKRLLMVIPLLLGVVIIVFSIVNMIPGDPGRIILGASAEQSAVDQLNHELGYDQPFVVRLLNYIKGVVTRFEFGNSYTSSKSVVREIAANFRYTFKFTVMGTLLYVLLGIPLGVMSAVKQYSAGDNIVRIMAMFIASFPGFWMGMLGVLFFSLKLDWLPSNGVETWRHYILPVAVFGITQSAGLLRLTRTTMLEAIRQDYVRTARAKGASERTVIWRHAFRNAMLPLIMTVGVSFGSMLGGTVLLESIFSMPGLGSLALTAIRSKDIPLVMATTIFLASIFCLMVLLVDIVSAFADPRVRAKYTS